MLILRIIVIIQGTLILNLSLCDLLYCFAFNSNLADATRCFRHYSDGRSLTVQHEGVASRLRERRDRGNFWEEFSVSVCLTSPVSLNLKIVQRMDQETELT
jgi:hypothetical protein